MRKVFENEVLRDVFRWERDGLSGVCVMGQTCDLDGINKKYVQNFVEEASLKLSICSNKTEMEVKY